MDYIIGLREERKNDCLQLVTEMARAYLLCATTDTAQRLNVEVGFHKAVSGINLGNLGKASGACQFARQLCNSLN